MTTTPQPAPVGRVPSRGAQAGPPPVGCVPSRGVQAGPSPVGRVPSRGVQEDPPPRAALNSRTGKRRADRMRRLLARVKNMERDFGPTLLAPIFMEDLSFLVLSLRCAQAAHEECRKSRHSILQAFARVTPD